MLDMDLATLVLVAGTALLSGGTAFGAARARAQAFEESTRRELDSLRQEVWRLQQRLDAISGRAG